jgi:hypothetical protein
MTFEEFLEDVFIGKIEKNEQWLQEQVYSEIDGVPIIKSNFEIMFDKWIQDLSADDWLELGQDYGDNRSMDWY